MNQRLNIHHIAAGFLLMLTLLASATAGAASFPELTGRVVDEAAMLSTDTRQQLEHMLASLESATDDQLVVVTVEDLDGLSIEDYGYQLGRSWGIGQKDQDNGALLIVAKKAHKIRIEVGYGLEDRLTDAKSSMIIRRLITPAFKQGEFEQGILQGTAAMVEILGGKPPSELAEANDQQLQQESSRDERPSLSHVIAFVVLMIAIIAVFGGGGGPGGRRRRRGMPLFIPIGGGGMHGGGLGGGFSGGGGSFGGGGASGGW